MSYGIKLRPSEAARWTTCTASPKLIETAYDNGLIDENDSGGEWANEGTIAHAFAAFKLDPACNPAPDFETIGAKYPEMAGYVNQYVEFCQNQIRNMQAPLHIGVEETVPLFYDTAKRGTVDFALINDDGTRIVICDLKYGAGVSVQAKYNKQLAIYAMSWVKQCKDLFDFGKNTLINICVFQPRVTGEDAVRLWSVTLEELEAFCATEIEPHVRDIKAGETQFQPSERTCQFCPVKAMCTARAELVLHGAPTVQVVEIETVAETTAPDIEVAKPLQPELLSQDQLEKVLLHRAELKKWLDDVYDFALSEATSGRKSFAGFKLVAGRSVRKWANEQAAEEFMRSQCKADECMPRKLLSPTQAEKLLKDKKVRKGKLEMFESLVTKPEGAPTLVTVDDKRPPLQLQIDAVNEFGDDPQNQQTK